MLKQSWWLMGVMAMVLCACSSTDDNKEKDAAVDSGKDVVSTDVEAGSDSAEDQGPDLPPDQAVDTVAPGPWHPMSNPAGTTLNAIWGTGPNEIYAVGDTGVILAFDGSKWKKMNSNTSQNLHGVYGVSKNIIFAVGDEIAVMLELQKCGEINKDAGPPKDVGPQDAAPKDSTPMDSKPLDTIAADTAVDDAGVDLLADGFISSDECHPGQYCDTDGYCKPGTWQKVYDSSWDSDFRAGWGTGKDDFWVVGLDGTIRHKNDSSMWWDSKTSGTSENLNGIWGVSKDEIYAVGDNGTILKWDGSTWEAMTSNTNAHLQSIWGTSSTNIYAAGLDGAIVHLDSSGEWKKMSTGSSSYFYGISGSSDKNIFVVGHPIFKLDESIFHSDGSTWTNLSPEVKAGSLNAVWVHSPDVAYAVGNFSILKFAGK